MATGIRTLITAKNREDRIAMVARDVRVLLDLGDVLVTVDQFVPKGTPEQNDMLHGLCDRFAKWWNARYPMQATAPEFIKWKMKCTYGLVDSWYDPETGERTGWPRSWRKYSKPERTALINASMAWMASQGFTDETQQAEAKQS